MKVNMFEIHVREEFAAAHFLPNHAGPCANLHGHTWLVEVTVRSGDLRDGMVIDFIDVKAILRELLPDHSLLNDIIQNPTAENMAHYFYSGLKSKIPGVYRVTVWESSRSGATYFED